MLKDLDDIDSVTKKPQAWDTTISNVRGLFDALIEKYPVMQPFLKSDAEIVHNKPF